MSDYTPYENLRDAPRITKSVFIKYEFRNTAGKTVGTGIATTRDMSLTGMKFLCAVNVKKDYVVKLSIQLDRISQVGVVGLVTWVETPKPRQYLVGVRFHSMPEVSRTKLLKFLHSSAPG
jgi:c-di-GMP-binding flagellar brake protein YcgR